MGGQSDNHSFPESAIVRDLESKLADLDKDCEVANCYQRLCADPSVVLALRCLALSVVAKKLNLYADHRAASILVDEISRQMNATEPPQLLSSIRQLKFRHPSIYQLNPLWFDRAASSAMDCIKRSGGQPSSDLPTLASASTYPLVPIYQQPRLQYSFDHSMIVKHQYPHRSNIILIALSTFFGAIALAMILAMEQSDVRQASGPAANSTTKQPQVALVLPAPSSPAASNKPPQPTLLEPGELIAPMSVTPIPTVISISTVLKSTIAANRPQNYSQLLTSNLDTHLYKKPVLPTSYLKPMSSGIQSKSQVDTNLKKICDGQPQICTYTVQDRTIGVTLLPEYIKKVQQTAADAADQDDSIAKQGLMRHLGSLNDAFDAVSRNSVTPLYLYTAEGKVIQKYAPYNP
jgi:hypothetical protein